MKNKQLFLGNCLDTLKTLEDNSIDSIVTDPPYGLSFMSKKWDYDVPSVEIWKECLRVLKPGGHLLSFGGTRTYHRLVVNIEDAGFEIRDCIQWLYGSGFPKSTDVSKRIDKEAGAEREVLGVAGKSGSIRNAMAGDFAGGEYMATTPATYEAKQWKGWGTALKPANEPICVARKPLEKGLTVAENVLKYGTGAINIDASRIEASDHDYMRTDDTTITSSNILNIPGQIARGGGHPQGRWPANIILDEVAAEMLDEQSGDTVSRFFYVAKASKSERNKNCGEILTWENVDQNLQDLMVELNLQVKDISVDMIPELNDTKWNTVLSGRNLTALYQRDLMYTILTVTKLITELKTSNYSLNSTTKENILVAIRTLAENGSNLVENAENIKKLKMPITHASTELVLGVVSVVLLTLQKIKELAKKGNVHSTVKPTKLMEYLIKLVTPPNGTVLDPFMGSGSTGVACKEDFNFIGCEMDESYIEIARKRINENKKE